MKDSFCNILTQVGQTQNDDNSKYLRRQSTLFNTHTRELIEGYTDENFKDENSIGITDFTDQMVLRFKNEKELSLYFESVDQLSQIIILKGQRVLLEKEHYGLILEKFLDVNKNFLNFLVQDEHYGEILERNNNEKNEYQNDHEKE